MFKARLRFALILCLAAFTAHAQIGKMSLPLYMYWKKQPSSMERVRLLVLGNAGAIEQFAGTHSGHFKFAAGDVSSIELPLFYVPALAMQNGVTRIEGLSGYNGHILDERTDTNTYMRPVRKGAGLTQAYTGKDVIMGFIDTGIDFNHPDFKNPSDTTKTRILRIWDQNAAGTPPSGYSYGTEWDSSAINKGTCTHDDPANEYGHGTNVAGLGAGNGRAGSTYTGIAPASDIMVVSTLFDNNFLSNVLDGVKYIFDKADALGKPCVINISEGDYSGGHDGRDLYARLLNNLITAKPGHMVVCAAGNAGNAGNWHLGYAATSTPQFTFFNYTNYYGAVAFELFTDSANINGFQFALGAVNNSYNTNRGTTAYLNFTSLHLAKQNIDSITGTITGVGSYTIYVQAHDSVIDASFFITPTNTTDHWRLLTKGSGRCDVWSSYNVFGTSDMISSGVPSAYQTGYVYPDNLITTVGYFTLADKCITVANYNNRNTYTDYYGTTQYLNSISSLITVGAIASSSSLGPTRLFKTKPEIAAPGDATMAPSRLATATALIANGQGYKVAPGGKYNRNGGTSLASPVVAGIVALYLQKHPKARCQQIKDAIILNAITDKYTTAIVPNNTFGYGKVNAYATLKNDFTDTCTSPCVAVSIIHQPNHVYVCTGKPAVLHITAAGGCVKYQWQASTDSGKTFYNISNATPYKGTNTDSLSIYPVTAGIFNTGYRCVVTGCYAGIASQAVHVRAVSAATLAARVVPDTNNICYNSRAYVRMDSTLSAYTTWQYSVNPGSNSALWTTLHSGSDTASVAPIKQPTYIRALININGCSAFSTPLSIAIPDSALHLNVRSITTHNVELRWNKTHADSFTVIVNGTSSATTRLNTYILTGLYADSTYKIVLKEKGNPCGNKHDSVTVKTLCTPVTLSITGTSNNTISVSISGGSGNYKLYYKLLYAGSYALTSATSASTTLKGLVAGITYALYAVDAASNCPNKTTALSYANTTGGTCTATAPTFSAPRVTNSSITLRWTGSASAFVYAYQKHGTTIGNSYTTTSDSGVITGLPSNTLYDVWVINRCTSPAAFGYATRIDTIRTKSGCGTPYNLLLSNINCHGFDATWNTVAGAKDYSVVFTNTLSGSSFSYAATTNTYTIQTLSPSTPWHINVRVRTCGTGYGGPSSNTEAATLPVCPHKTDNNNATPPAVTDDIKIYPNPATNYIIIAAVNPWQKLYLCDALGRVMYSNLKTNYNLEVDVHTYAAGIYFCTVVMPNGHTYTQKIFITP